MFRVFDRGIALEIKKSRNEKKGRRRHRIVIINQKILNYTVSIQILFSNWGPGYLRKNTQKMEIHTYNN